MSTVEGNIETLSQAIMGEARAETEELRQRALSKADSIRQRAQESAARERSAILDQAETEARRLRGQSTSTAQMKARALELAHREELLERVFAAVEKRLQAFPERKDYPAIVQHLVKEAVSQLRADSAVLRADKATQLVLSKTVVDEIAREAGVHLTMGEPLDSGTGVIAQASDGRLRFDNTFETRLARMQGAIRSVVYRILMGEKE
jgi:V/A-type H+-transporting ATPase subunit E